METASRTAAPGRPGALLYRGCEGCVCASCLPDTADTHTHTHTHTVCKPHTHKPYILWSGACERRRAARRQTGRAEAAGPQNQKPWHGVITPATPGGRCTGGGAEITSSRQAGRQSKTSLKKKRKNARRVCVCVCPLPRAGHDRANSPVSGAREPHTHTAQPAQEREGTQQQQCVKGGTPAQMERWGLDLHDPGQVGPGPSTTRGTNWGCGPGRHDQPRGQRQT